MFWLAVHIIGVLEQASRFGQFLSRLARQTAYKRNWKRLISRSGGNDLLGIIFLRPRAAKLLFERLQDLSVKKSQPLEFHQDLILPLKISFVQWMFLWTPESGLSRQDWEIHWKKMQDLKKEVNPIGVVYDQPYVNANTSRDIYNFYQSAVDRDSLGRWEQTRLAAGLPFEQSQINSEVKGEVVFKGDYLLYNTKLSVHRECG